MGVEGDRSGAAGKLMTALMELSAERGYRETSVADIVGRAGLDPGTFYELFADKDACAIAAENAVLGGVVSAISSTYQPDRPELESVILGVKTILEMTAQNATAAYFGYVGARQMSPPAVFSIYDTGHKVMVAMLDRLWEYSSLRLQPARAALGALGGGEAVVRREVVAGRGASVPRLLPDLAYMATVSFVGQSEAGRLAGFGRELLRGSRWG